MDGVLVRSDQPAPGEPARRRPGGQRRIGERPIDACYVCHASSGLSFRGRRDPGRSNATSTCVACVNGATDPQRLLTRIPAIHGVPAHEQTGRVARLHECRLGGALERRAPPPVPVRPGAMRPSPRRTSGAVLLFDFNNIRYDDEHPHRRMGARQDDPLRAADSRRSPAHLGLRVGRQAPSAELPVATARERPRRDDRPARRRCARRRPVPRGRPGDRRHPQG